MFGIYAAGRRNIFNNLIRLGRISNLNLSSESSSSSSATSSSSSESSSSEASTYDILNAPLAEYPFESLVVSSPHRHVYHVELNRPEKMNSFNKVIWREIKECFDALGEDSNCRAVVLSGRGKLFTAGIDIGLLFDIGKIVTKNNQDVARKSRGLKKIITKYQDSLSSLEKCPKPVIAAIHNACIGAGVDLICAADIRYCSLDAWFQVKEVEAGLAADVGTLQRLPKIIGSESVVRELCFSSREFYAGEAEKLGFVSRVLPDKETLVKSALDLAAIIAEKSPVAVQTTKEALIHSRDHAVHEGLEFIADRNMSSLQSEDIMNATLAMMKQDTATFNKY